MYVRPVKCSTFQPLTSLMVCILYLSMLCHSLMLSSNLPILYCQNGNRTDASPGPYLTPFRSTVLANIATAQRVLLVDRGFEHEKATKNTKRTPERSHLPLAFLPWLRHSDPHTKPVAGNQSFRLQVLLQSKMRTSSVTNPSFSCAVPAFATLSEVLVCCLKGKSVHMLPQPQTTTDTCRQRRQEVGLSRRAMSDARECHRRSCWCTAASSHASEGFWKTNQTKPAAKK